MSANIIQHLIPKSESKINHAFKNKRHFTNKRTLQISNVPFRVKAKELFDFLNNVPICRDSVERVQLNLYSANKHSGKGRVLFTTRCVVNNVLKHYRDSPDFVIKTNKPDIFCTWRDKKRALKFTRWRRRKRNQTVDEEEEKKLYEHDDNDNMYHIGDAIYTFASRSYHINHENHTIYLDSVAFDFSINCIRARHSVHNTMDNMYDDVYDADLFGISFGSSATPKAIEYRIPFRNIINQMKYCINANMLVINMYHPVQKYKVLEDRKFADFDTELELCEKMERSICDPKYAQNMLIKIKCCEYSFTDELIEWLKNYNLLDMSYYSKQRVSSIQSNTFTISNPPKCTYILPENIQYLLACLHTKQPSKLSYSSMSNDSKFIELVHQYSNKHINILLSTALEHMFWDSTSDYIDEPCQALQHYIDQKYNPTHSNDIEDGFGLIRHAWISLPTIQLLPPYLETTNRVVRWYPQLNHHFIRITFCEDDGSRFHQEHSLSKETKAYMKYILSNGIYICKRKYEFLAFGSSQLNEQSCWMYCNTQNITANDIRNRMGNFSNIKSVAKYAARMGQCFSTTLDSIKTNHVIQINDIIREFPEEQYIPELFTKIDIPNDLIASKIQTEICFSDGIGRISPSFAAKVSIKLGLTRRPSAFQIRYGGYKGMVSIYPQCKYDLELRDSMNKFASNDTMFEVCRYSFCSPSYLNRQIITLFETLNNNINTTNTLVKIAEKCINKLTKMRIDRNIAINELKLRSFHGNNVLNPMYTLIELLNKTTIPLQHPFISSAIEIFIRSELKQIQNRHRILIENGTSILGVMDEYNVLKPNQVFIQIQTPLINKNAVKLITGNVIITKCPALAPGDLRKFEAVASMDVYTKLKHLKNVIVFSQQGIISPTMQMSGSDLDGDIYWVTWDKLLLSCFKDIYNEKPLYFPVPKPKMVENVTINDLIQFFLDYMQMDCLGMLAHSHLAVADQELNRAKNNKCLILSVLNSYAVDYRKSGTPVDIKSIVNWYGIKNRQSLLTKKFPYFMRKYNSIYQSEHALGEIYRHCTKEIKILNNKNKYGEIYMKCDSFNQLLMINGYEKYIGNAQTVLDHYKYDILSIKNRWCIKTEIELFMNRPLSNIKIPNLKDFDIKQKIKNSMNGIKNKYRSIFFDEFKINKDNDVLFMMNKFSIEMKQKACAWYFVTMKTIYENQQTNNYNNVVLTLPFVVFDVLCNVLS
eukprot:85192_1